MHDKTLFKSFNNKNTTTEKKRQRTNTKKEEENWKEYISGIYFVRY